LATTVKHHHPSQQLDKLQIQLNTLSRELQQTMRNLIAQKKSSCEKAMQLLHTVSPLNTLQRGYAIVLDEQQHVVRSITEAQPGNQLSTKLSDGTLLCTVNKIIPGK
jgi:exodeoxyribonuclease VII large subunit